MSDSFGGIGEILEDVLLDDYDKMKDYERARTQILMERFSGPRAPFRYTSHETKTILLF